MGRNNFEATALIKYATDAKLSYTYDNASGNASTKLGIDTDDFYHLGIIMPTIETAIMYLLVSNDGATFVRLQLADGSGDWNVASGTGAKAISVDVPFRFIRIELSQNQTANRTFYINGKRD